MRTTRRTRQKTVGKRVRPVARNNAKLTDESIANMTLAKTVQLPEYAKQLWKPYRYKVLWGGRGATRSWTAARCLLLMAAQKKLRILCTRELQSSLRDSVHQLLRDQIDLMELPGFRVTDREIRHVNGSLFLFEGLRHNKTKIKSLEGIDICWVEEAERISKMSWSILIPTIRKMGSEIWVTFNPDQEEDATYQRLIVHTPQHAYVKKVSWQDNPWLSDELRAEKDYDYASDPESADHIWGGNIRVISNAQILHGKWLVQEFTVPMKIREDGTREPLWNGPYQGVDFGFGSDPFAGMRCWTYDQILYVEYEVYKHHLELDHTPGELTGTIPQFAEYVTRGDSARPDSISHLRRHGIHRIVSAKKGAGSVEDGIAHLRSYRQIIVHPRCPHFAQECKFYSYKIDEHSGDVLPIIIDKHNHLIDSIRYALEPLMKKQRLRGFMFVADTEGIPLCPECESRIPDDGICPHCGWSAHSAGVELHDAVPQSTFCYRCLLKLPADAIECSACGLQTPIGFAQSQSAVVPASDAEMFVLQGHARADIDTIQQRVHDLTTRHENGNGHSNGNGKHESPASHGTTTHGPAKIGKVRRTDLRGIND